MQDGALSNKTIRDEQPWTHEPAPTQPDGTTPKGHDGTKPELTKDEQAQKILGLAKEA